ncbi:MAG: Lrp/AsnC family transcriptional regulator [Chloroflexota bacterium]
MDADLDFIDLKILEILQQDGRASHSAVAEAVGLSQPSVHERVKKLEQRGIIRGYAALVDPEALGLDVLAFVSVRLGDYKPDDIASSISGIPEVVETHHIAGDECFIVKVRCRTNKDLQDILQRIWAAGPVTGSKTTIAFATYKETTALPLPTAEPAREKRSA